MSLRKPGDGGGGSARRAGSPEEAREFPECAPGGRLVPLLPWDRFSAWLHCVCVVGFDLELGQAVERLKGKEPPVVCLRLRKLACSGHWG